MTGFAQDHRSGSGQIATSFLEELERWIATDTSRDANALRAALLGWLKQAQAAQPSMALIHQLASRALEVADTGRARHDSAPDLRAHLARSCEVERRDLAEARSAVAKTANGLLTEPEPWIATMSQSGTVLEAVVRAQKAGRRPAALVGESRPLLEGRALATSLAAAGIPVWLLADAALPLLVSQARMVWLGVDAVTDRGVVVKIGGFALALAAREHSVPVYALAERRKFLPAATTALKIVEMPGDEIWKTPSEGVRPRNIYFEVMPLELLAGVVVEDAVLGLSEAATTARERAISEELTGA